MRRTKATLQSIVFLTALAAAVVACGSSASEVAPPKANVPSLGFFSTATETSTEMVEVTNVLTGMPVSVRLSGFEANSEITIRSRMTTYEASAIFRVNADGTVDTGTQAPESGSYDGVDVDGIFWSAVDTKTASTNSPTPDGIYVTAERDGAVVASGTIHRYYVADGQKEISVTDDGLVGVYVTPGSPGPHPTLITFGGSEGGLDSGRALAEYHASRGYACLGLAYFGATGVPETLASIPIEYFKTAIAWLRKQPDADVNHLGVLGASRGGELALLLGSTLPEVRAVVAEVPSGLIWPGFTSTGDIAAPWSLGGKDLPFIPVGPGAMPTYTKNASGNSVEHDTPLFVSSLNSATPDEVAAATIHVENTNGPIFMFGGSDDQIWPSCQLAQVAMDRLTTSGHATTFADSFTCYSDAGHAISLPGWPTTDPQEAYIQTFGTWLAFGGTSIGMAHAARDMFTRQHAFLDHALRP